MAGFPLGRGRQMRPEHVEEFLATSRAFLKIATNGADGYPLVNPVWYVWRDGEFIVVTKEQTGLVQNLRRDPRVCLLVDNPETPYIRITAKSTADFRDYDWHEVGREMVLRYLGPNGFAYYDATTDIPRVVVHFRPERMTTWDGGGVDRTFFEPSLWHEIQA
jgi:PPOX class probable F420-dependent enzyme